MSYQINRYIKNRWYLLIAIPLFLIIPFLLNSSSAESVNSEIVEWISTGPGGGGSASGIAIVEDELFLGIDVGGVRRLSISNDADGWTTENLEGDNFGYNLVTALLSDGSYVFAGTQLGQLHRWDPINGWINLLTLDNKANISALYRDPRPDVNDEDILYIGTGSIKMRHNIQDRQHPKDYGNGYILMFKDATTSNPLRQPLTISLENRDIDMPNILDMLIVKGENSVLGEERWYMYIATDLGVYRTEATSVGNFDPLPPLINNGIDVGNLNARTLAESEVIGETISRVVLTVDKNFENNVLGPRIYYQTAGVIGWTAAAFDPTSPTPTRLWSVIADQSTSFNLFACDNSGAGALYTSDDSGATWDVFFDSTYLIDITEAGPFVPNKKFQCVYAVLSGDDIYVVGANDGGIWRIDVNDASNHEYLTGSASLYYGSTPYYWTGNGEIEFWGPQEVAFAPDDPSLIYVVMNDHVGMVKDPDSQAWKMFGGGGRGHSVTVNDADPDMAFFANATQSDQTASISLTTNRGESWDQILSNNIFDWTWPGAVSLIVVEEGGTRWLYAAGKMTTVSTGDNGWAVKKINIANINVGNWQQADERQFWELEILGMDIVSATADTIFLATEEGLWYYNFNRGEWVQMLSDWFVAEVEATPSGGAYVLAKRNGNFPEIFSVDCIMSPIFECSETSTGYSEGPMMPAELEFHDDILFVAHRNEGVLGYDVTSIDPWFIVLNQDSGLPSNDIRTIDFDSEGNVYVGFKGFGLWKSPKCSTVITITTETDRFLGTVECTNTEDICIYGPTILDRSCHVVDYGCAFSGELFSFKYCITGIELTVLVVIIITSAVLVIAFILRVNKKPKPV